MGLLKREARKQGISVSAVARKALEESLGVDPEQRKRLSFAGIGRSGENDVAERVEDILAEEWGRVRDR